MPCRRPDVRSDVFILTEICKHHSGPLNSGSLEPIIRYRRLRMHRKLSVTSTERGKRKERYQMP